MTPADYATAAAIILLGSLAWWYATHAGKDEAEQIARNIALNVQEDLPHDELLMQRIGWLGSAWVAIWMILGALLVMVFGLHWSRGIIVGIPLAAFPWAVFTIRHRYTINRERGKHWLYTAPWGNVYDRRMYWISQGFRPMTLTRVHLEALKDCYTIGLRYGGVVDRIHRAGLLAYAFEALVAAGAVVVAMWIA